MARTKKISENMGDLIEALAKFRSNEATIRAEYARKAEEEISRSRDEVLDLMFIRHHESGPSEIANTTGLSRSTVIRWRDEWRARQAALPESERFVPLPPEEVAKNDALIASGDYTEEEIYGVGGKANQPSGPTFEFSLEHSEESNEKVHAIVNTATGEKVYVIWGDVYTSGRGVDDSPEVARPDWLTDELLASAEHATNMDIPGATHR
ncbi:helix-turn-helix DNA binding protein [Microbacterium phage Alleb]|nr:helix-turn-helix DNA binding protein [Microbacterium phage Alleb]